MSVLNRRNAFLGWLTWAGLKFILRQKAKSAMPKVDVESRRLNRSAIALVVASAIGLAVFWRSRAAGDDAIA
jgi:hypothetical protein